ncbi:MAG: MFS transporter [candidate division Zixibacteria bacterium]|nr:MFS transporter [candidate division Zixibacteria bacterium]
MDKIRVYSIVRLLTSFALGTILPVYVLYFRHYQINLFQIALLAAIFEASILIFEMPTGLVADTYGRKISVILSALVSVISGIFFIFFPILFGFIIAGILNGLGETLRSGALEAWLVDSLKHAGKEEKIKYAFAQGTKYRIIGNLSGLILGGYLASLNMKLVWIPFTLIFSILCMFLILKMKEEYKIGKTISDRILSRISETIKKSLIVIKSQKLIFALLLLALFSEFSFETISQYWQVHLSENLSIKTEYFGWILVISSVITILLIDKVTKLSEKFKHEISSLVILEILFLLSLLVIALTFSPILAILFFVLLQSIVSFKEPIFLDLYNKHIPSEQRATLLSFQSLVGSGGEVLAGLCIGVVALKFGLRITFGLGSVVLFLGLVLFVLFARSKRN